MTGSEVCGDFSGLISGQFSMLVLLFGGGPQSLPSSLETGQISTPSSLETAQALEDKLNHTPWYLILEIRPRFSMDR